jgi:hypothetical protein
MDDESPTELPVEEPSACDLLPLPRWGEFLVVIDRRGTLYTTLGALCDFVGINANMQRKRAQEHPVIRRHLRRFVVAYDKGGRQPTLCIEMRVAAYWLGTINPRLVREDLQDELVAFQEDLIDAANDLLMGRALHAGDGEDEVPEVLTREWAEDLTRRNLACQREIQRLHFMYSGLRRRVRDIESTLTAASPSLLPAGPPSSHREEE